ncbi:hypothetical protein pEaSNUABM11_00295 [Erwinia phage pEa_SNUABM_11]|nr:hypothetical protein pEaSNUABM11_00295 [Erwinia phage pEa_SNUABM_11]
MNLEEHYNKPLTVSGVCELLAAEPLLSTVPQSTLAAITNVYLGNHHIKSENATSRWVTVTAGGSGKDVCVAQGKGDARSEGEIYQALLASALTTVIERIEKTAPPSQKSIELFVPRNNPSECGFVVDGEVMPVAPFVEWIRAAQDEFHNRYALLLEHHFESLQFMRFPNDAAVALVGKLRQTSGGNRVPVCVTYFEGINGVLKAIHEMVREHQRLTTYPDTFDYLTSINPDAGEA